MLEKLTWKELIYGYLSNKIALEVFSIRSKEIPIKGNKHMINPLFDNWWVLFFNIQAKEKHKNPP